MELLQAELAVLGGGPAGWYCALEAARAGFRTVLAERAELGGTGFRWGCLPVKMGLDSLRRGRPALPGPAALRAVERRLEEALRAAGVQVLAGEARFLDEHLLEAGGSRLRAQTVVIATGSRPAAPPGLRLDGRRVAAHDGLLRLGRAPRSVAVVGADVEGAELACLLAGLGARVHLLEREAEILPGQDRDLAGPVQEGLQGLGVRLLLGRRVLSAASTPRGAVAGLEDGEELAVDLVLATGLRAPNLPPGLEKAGVESGAEGIPVDEGCRTSAAHVYAIGDVNGRCGLAHAAIRQGLLLPAALRGGPPPPAACPAPPRALFTLPEIAGAGLQERELEARGQPYRRARVELAETWRGLSRGLGQGFVKVLADPDGRLLGIWACGEDASELSAPYGPLLERGATVGELKRGLFIHPTLSEALLEACRRL